MSNPPTLSPAEFGRHLQALLESAAEIAALPLEDMNEYLDVVERMAETAETATPLRRQTITKSARLVAAALHLRAVARLPH